MKCIVGLGNPGTAYRCTRHNAGFLSLDGIISEWQEDKHSHALYAKVMIGEEKVLFAQPQNYMNRSGEVVARFIRNRPLQSEDILVVHDDLDLPLGSLRFSFERGAGGHNGVESIIQALGTKKFHRLRIGIGSDLPGKRPENWQEYVLATFLPSEKEKLAQVLTVSSEAIRAFVTLGPEKTATLYNAS